MSQLNYTSYREDIIKLARSIIIKSEHVAQLINTDLISRNIPVDFEKPWTWKYYMNLAGEYHPTDPKMTVRSMDTLEIIDFTKDNLLYHRATAREYQRGSSYYNALKAKYPNSVTLINGIISPIEIEKAINSDNGDILYYDSNLIESNEDNLVRGIQDWIRTYYLNWFNPQYLITDDLYLHYFIGSLYVNLPKAIENLRLRNAHTRRAHSYHIREHLASNGKLDRFIPYLTKEQQLWLYRNIRYLLKNSGKQENFDILVDKLLTARGIPLVKYSIKQNTTKMPDEIYPDVEMVKENITGNSITPGTEKTTVRHLLEREFYLARDNKNIIYDAEQQINERVKVDGFSKLPTKVLDSEVIDRSNSSIKSLFNILLNQWTYLASSGRYRAYVQIPHPKSGEYMSLTVKDALIITYYAMGEVFGYPFLSVPKVIAYDVLRTPLPTFGELKAITDPKYVPDALIRGIMDTFEPTGDYISTEKFYQDCTVLHKNYLKQWKLYSLQEHIMTRSYAEQLVRRHYMHVKCSLLPETTSYLQYFKEKQLDFTDLDETELRQLMMDCISIATGSNLVTIVTMSEIQRELLALLGQLSSYPLQFLRNVALTDFTVLGLTSTRFGDHSSATFDRKDISIDDWNVRSMTGRTHIKTPLPIETIDPTISLKANLRLRAKYDPTVYMKEKIRSIGKYKIDVSDVSIRTFSFTMNTTEEPGTVMDQYQNSNNPDWPKV